MMYMHFQNITYVVTQVAVVHLHAANIYFNFFLKRIEMDDKKNICIFCLFYALLRCLIEQERNLHLVQYM